MLNRTVTDARLTLQGVTGDGSRFRLAHWEGLHITPFALDGTGLRLFVHQTIDVGEEGHCQTADYQYRLASGDQKADWLLRWEYFRTPPTPGYSYTRAHLHVKATLATGDRDLPKLHVPTARVPLELVLWHVIAEWG